MERITGLLLPVSPALLHNTQSQSTETYWIKGFLIGFLWCFLLEDFSTLNCELAGVCLLVRCFLTKQRIPILQTLVSICEACRMKNVVSASFCFSCNPDRSDQSHVGDPNTQGQSTWMSLWRFGKLLIPSSACTIPLCLVIRVEVRVAALSDTKKFLFLQLECGPWHHLKAVSYLWTLFFSGNALAQEKDGVLIWEMKRFFKDGSRWPQRGQSKIFLRCKHGMWVTDDTPGQQ